MTNGRRPEREWRRQQGEEPSSLVFPMTIAGVVIADAEALVSYLEAVARAYAARRPGG